MLTLCALLMGCAAKPPIPLDQYIPLRDAARDYMGAVERDACSRTSTPAVKLCTDTASLRSELKPADATLIKGYSSGGLSKEQWEQALGVVTGVLGKALKSFVGLPQ